MTHFGLSVKETYSEITDEQIESIIGDVQSLHFHWNSCTFTHRIRECHRLVDPEGSCLHRRRLIGQRKYSVPDPNWLWHIDGNHKLIK